VKKGGGDKEDKESITDWLIVANDAALDALKNTPIKMDNPA
jgi:hypothetical protein